MKTIIIVLSVFLAVSFGASPQTTSNKEIQKTTYTCPMHPKEMSDKEGKCSKCGMKMVKTTEAKHNTAVKGSQSSSTVKAMYVCPMHPKEMSDKQGKCTKCGMDMTKMEDKK